MKPLLKRIGIWVLVFFVLFNVLCAFQAYHFTRFYDNVPHTTAADMGFFEKTSAILLGVPMAKSKVVDSLRVPHSSIILTTSDGFKIAGWKLAHDKTDTNTIVRGTVIMFHGHGSCRSGIIPEATAFYNMGWNVLMIDFRSHGESEGTVCSIGINEVRDVKAAYDTIVAGGEKNIVLWGISMGAATISKAMHDYADMQPKKVILEMPFGTMLEAAEGLVRNMHLPDEPLAVELTFWGSVETGMWSFSNKPQEYVKAIHCPVLLQRGEKDIRVTAAETAAIYENLGSAQKAFVSYEGLGHISLYQHATEKWMQTVTTFLKP